MYVYGFWGWSGDSRAIYQTFSGMYGQNPLAVLVRARPSVSRVPKGIANLMNLLSIAYAALVSMHKRFIAHFMCYQFLALLFVDNTILHVM